MAQPAVNVNEERADLLGIPPFWAIFSVNPPTLVTDVDWAVLLGCGTQRKPLSQTMYLLTRRQLLIVRMTGEWNAERRRKEPRIVQK